MTSDIYWKITSTDFGERLLRGKGGEMARVYTGRMGAVSYRCVDGVMTPAGDQRCTPRLVPMGFGTPIWRCCDPQPRGLATYCSTCTGRTFFGPQTHLFRTPNRGILRSVTDALIVANLPLVRPWIVREWHRRADPQDLDDLIAEGVLGLVQAGRAYDPDRGPFWGFARSRVMGAVLDLVTRRYAKRRGRPPQLTPDLDQHSSDQSDVAGRLPEIRARVEEHLAHLPRRQRAAVLLHVVDGLPLSEVGRRIGCSESMASRLLRGVRGHAERLLVEEAA